MRKPPEKYLKLALIYWEMRADDTLRAYEFYRRHRREIDEASFYVANLIIKERRRQDEKIRQNREARNIILDG